MCVLNGLSVYELHRGCPIVHEDHEERSHENTMQSRTQELFFRLTSGENTPSSDLGIIRSQQVHNLPEKIVSRQVSVL